MYTTEDKHDEKKENSVTTVDMKNKYNIESLKMRLQNFYINRD